MTSSENPPGQQVGKVTLTLLTNNSRFKLREIIGRVIISFCLWLDFGLNGEPLVVSAGWKGLDRIPDLPNPNSPSPFKPVREPD